MGGRAHLARAGADWGGEELAVLLPHRRITQAKQVAEKLRCAGLRG